ncbi:UNVERIFIED_CONTAM: Linoleate 13S-lipoxygenase 2-1, chloroplastic [Sesamum radiatum]|uniref:Linoleate 13S-lipoxygenase 2-1, chloroplastic n=1 Tax=Sesamum radiatum TaxID=300843 RepID=A0AAW2W3U3_SESRA
MLKHSFHNSHSTPQTLVPTHKPFLCGGGNAAAPFAVAQKCSVSTKKQKKIRLRRIAASNGVKAALTTAEKSTAVKAVVTVLRTVGGVLTHLGLDRGLDDITDLLGKTLLIELVAAELDPSK